MINIIYFILFILFPSLIFSQIYYVSSSSGNDSNNGKNENQPFKTIEKINELTLKPKDRILFKKGDIWKGEQLIIKDSGTEDNPIIFTSYGSGDNPIITLRKSIPTTWTWVQDTRYTNVWYANVVDQEKFVNRVWLNGVAKETANYPWTWDEEATTTSGNWDNTAGICVEHPYWHNFDDAVTGGNDQFYIYSVGNPYSYYESIEYFGGLLEPTYAESSVFIENANYITLENIDIQAGNNSLQIYNSDYITIKDCNIGKYAGRKGLIAHYGSDYGKIINCTFDSDWDITIKFYLADGSKAIELIYGANNWEIYDNVIKDFVLNVYFGTDLVYAPGKTSYNHKFYNNEISAARVNYGKGIELYAYDGLTQPINTNVEIYNNYIHNIPAVGLNIVGSYNKIHHNIISDINISTKTQKATESNSGKGIDFNIDQSKTGSYPGAYNDIFNNTIYDSETYPLFSREYNRYYNNIVLQSGKSTMYRQSALTSSEKTHAKNNLFFRDGSTSSSDIIYDSYALVYYTVSGFNNISSTDNVYGNFYSSKSSENGIMNSTFTLPTSSDALNAGIDISSLISSGFKDRWGNTVNRTTPNIGAYGGVAASENNNSTNNNIKVYLEAPFKNDKMNTLINKIKLLPSSQPFNSTPWEYKNNVTKSNFEDNIVDWLLVELRENQNSIRYSKPALLTDDGIILNIDGSNFHFSNITSGDYYLVVRHRNHLDIMSAEKIRVTNNEPINYDFTISKSQAYGTNSMVDLGEGKFGMYAGDADANGVINNLDFGVVANKIPSNGYNRSDLDMNGITNVLDYNYINKNILKSSSIK